MKNSVLLLGIIVGFVLIIIGAIGPEKTKLITDNLLKKIVKTEKATTAEEQTPRNQRETALRTIYHSPSTFYEGEFYFQPSSDVETETASSKGIFKDALETFQKINTSAPTFIIIEGHSDPLHLLNAQKNGFTADEIASIKKAAEDLSLQMAEMVKKALIAYCSTENIAFDTTQILAIGYGTTSPKFPEPTTEEEWLQNRRVVIMIKQYEQTTTNEVKVSSPMSLITWGGNVAMEYALGSVDFLKKTK